MAHQTNFEIQTLSNLPLVFHIENLLQWLYDYFNHIPKRPFEFTKLVEFMEFKGNIIFLNIKSRWIFMINFVKYCIFFNIAFFS